MAPYLDGCLDVDLESSAMTNATGWTPRGSQPCGDVLLGRSIGQVEHQLVKTMGRVRRVPQPDDLQMNRATGQAQDRTASVALVAFEPDEPVETVPVDDLPVGCAPWPRLQVVHDPATFGQTGEPVAQGCHATLGLRM
jgi:hypothetical protein